MAQNREKHSAAYKELQRIFGHDHVSEELLAGRSRLGKAEWCYLFSVEPAGHGNVKPYEDLNVEGHMAINLQMYLANRFHGGRISFENRDNFRIKGEKYREPEMLRFAIPADEAERPDRLGILKRLSMDAVQTALVMPEHMKLHEGHMQDLRNATHNLGWMFISGREGEGYQSTAPVKNADALQMALLSRMGCADSHFVEAGPEGHACITLAAMLAARPGSLRESIIPEAYCKAPGHAAAPRIR